MDKPELPRHLRIEILNGEHRRSSFTCGVPALDLYFARQARQDLERKLAAVFVLASDDGRVEGFYTLSALTILAQELPPIQAKKLPRFPIPATLLGRMAVGNNLQGQGFGELLLLHALHRALGGAREVASWAVVVDAKQGARDFYLKYGFLEFPSQPHRLFLPMSLIEKLDL